MDDRVALHSPPARVLQGPRALVSGATTGSSRRPLNRDALNGPEK